MQSLDIELEEGEKIYGDSGKLVRQKRKRNYGAKTCWWSCRRHREKNNWRNSYAYRVFSERYTRSCFNVWHNAGQIKAIELGEGEAFVAEHYAFLAAEDSVKFTIQIVSLGAAFFGGAGLVLQKFEGPGVVFIHTVGDIIEYELDGTKALEVDPGHIAGFSAALDYRIKFVDNIRTAMFGGIGIFLQNLRERPCNTAQYFQI